MLMAALPQSRMVLLVRDPRDFAASVLDATRKGGWMQEGMDEWARRDLDTEKDVQRYLKGLSRQYVRQMGNGKKAFDEHNGLKILVKYDALRTNTLDTMRELCTALELPVDEQKLAEVVDKHSFENIPQRERGEGKFYRKAISGGWKEDLTAEQAQIVEDITAPLIEEFS